VLVPGLSVPEMLQVCGAGVEPTTSLVLPQPAHRVRINEPNKMTRITCEDLPTAPHLSSYVCLASRPADQSRCCLAKEGRSFLGNLSFLTTRIGSSAGGGGALGRILAAEFLAGRYRQFTVQRPVSKFTWAGEFLWTGGCKVLHISSCIPRFKKMMHGDVRVNTWKNNDSKF
jgi:hypothetical protein